MHSRYFERQYVKRVVFITIGGLSTSVVCSATVESRMFFKNVTKSVDIQKDSYYMGFKAKLSASSRMCIDTMNIESRLTLIENKSEPIIDQLAELTGISRFSVMMKNFTMQKGDKSLMKSKVHMSD